MAEPALWLAGGQSGNPAGLSNPCQLAVIYQNLLSGGADIISGVATRTLVLTAGAITLASSSEIGVTETADEVAANLTVLRNIADFCTANGITVAVDADLTSGATWPSGAGAGQNELVDQWAPVAASVGLPISAVQDVQEIATAQSPATFASFATIEANAVSTLIEDYATSTYKLTASHLAVGDMEGAPPAMSDLTAWWSAYDAAATAAGVAQFSYTTADTGWFAPWLSPLSLSSWQGYLESISKLAAANGLALNVVIQGAETDTSASQFVRPAEQNAAGLAILQGEGLVDATRIAIESWDALPVGAGLITSPTSPSNEAAEIQAIYPLYAGGSITATGSVVVEAPGQLLVSTGTTAAVGLLTLQWAAADVEAGNRLGLVIIDQTGTLSARAHGTGTATNQASNILILSGDAADLTAELGSLSLSEANAGPDTIDIETYAASGPLADAQISVLAAAQGQAVGGIAASSGQQGWSSAAAFLNSGSVITGGSVLTSETIDWSSSGTGAFVKIDAVHEPLAEYGVEDAPATLLGTANSEIADVYDPSSGDDGAFPSGGYANNPGVNNVPLNTALTALADGWLGSAFDPDAEYTPLSVQSTISTFDPASGQLERSADSFAPDPLTVVTLGGTVADSFASAFDTAGTQVTEYNTGSNPNWLAGWGDQFSSATLTYDGSGKLTEMFLQGGASDPWFTVDDVFDPNTGELWEEFQSTSPPPVAQGTTNYAGAVSAAAAGYDTGNPYQPGFVTGPLYVTEFNTGDNPNWDYVDWGTGVASDTELWVDYLILENFPGFADNFPVAYDGAVNAYPYEFVNGSTLDLLDLPGTIAVDLNHPGTVVLASQTLATQLSGLTAIDAAGATGPVSLTGLAAGGSTLIGGDDTTSITGYGHDTIVAGAGFTGIDSGAGNSLISAASGAVLDVAGGQDLISLATGSTVGLLDGSGFQVAGSDDIIRTLGGVAVNVSGSGNQIVLGGSGGSTLGLLSGSGDTIAASASTIQTLSDTNANISGGDDGVVLGGSGGRTLGLLGGSGWIVYGAGAMIQTLGGTDFGINLDHGEDTVCLGISSDVGIIGSSGGIGFITGGAGPLLVDATPGAQAISGFELAAGDQIDLRQILAGVALAPDLSDLSRYVAASDVGSSTILTIAGSAGSDTVLLGGAGALSLQQLINGNAFALPAH